MRQLKPYRTLHGLRTAIDNGGRFYNLLPRQTIMSSVGENWPRLREYSRQARAPFCSSRWQLRNCRPLVNGQPWTFWPLAYVRDTVAIDRKLCFHRRSKKVVCRSVGDCDGLPAIRRRSKVQRLHHDPNLVRHL